MFGKLRQRLRLQMRWRRIVSRFQRRCGIERHSEYTAHPAGALHPLMLRRGSSDREVLDQVFVEREYGCLDDLTDVDLVIDCGANAGYSSAYFLSQFPRCRLIAVEPIAGNFDLLKRNLAPYGPRATAIRAGVWSHPAPLAVSPEIYRDGREWAWQVRECGPNEQTDFQGIDIGTLLADSGCERISILKMDVEGAEAVIFAENCRPWLDRVDAMAVELHDDTSFGPATGVFQAAIDGHAFAVTRSGELTICRRSSAAAAAGAP